MKKPIVRWVFKFIIVEVPLPLLLPLLPLLVILVLEPDLEFELEFVLVPAFRAAETCIETIPAQVTRSESTREIFQAFVCVQHTMTVFGQDRVFKPAFARRNASAASKQPWTGTSSPFLFPVLMRRVGQNL